MASSFWKGFANTLNTSLTKQRDREAESTEWERRKKMEMELEKKYGAEVVARTAVEGNEEVSYNKYGDIIRRRVLTAEELKLRQAEVDTTLAGARSAVAGAGLSEFNLEKAPEKWSLEQESIRSGIASNQASTSAANRRISLDEQRFAYDTGGGKGLPRDVQNGVDEVRTMVAALPTGDGVNTTKALMENFEEAISTASSPAEARRIVAQTKGQVLRAYNAAIAASKGTTGMPWENNGAGLTRVPGAE